MCARGSDSQRYRVNCRWSVTVGNACRRGPVRVNIMPHTAAVEKYRRPVPWSMSVHSCSSVLAKDGLLTELKPLFTVDEEEAEYMGFCWSFKHSRSMSTYIIWNFITKFHENLAGGSHACPWGLMVNIRNCIANAPERGRFSISLTGKGKAVPLQAQRVPGNWGSRISWQRHRMVVGCQPYAPAAFAPRK